MKRIFPKLGWGVVAWMIFAGGTGGVRAQTNGTSAVVAPDQAEQVQMDLANGFLAREFFDLALAEYQKYLTWFPSGFSVEEAMYRVGECHRGLKQGEAARDQYLALQKAFPNGAFFARASFRLGELDWNQERWAEALPYFKEAAERSPTGDATRLAARFYQARILLRLERGAEAPLQELARTESANPYRGFALLELARMAETGGREEEGRLLYGKVLETNSAAVLKAEAGMRAAAIEMKARRWSPAAAFLEKIRRLNPAGEWMPWVNWNLVQCHWQMNQFEAVLRLLSDPAVRVPADNADDAELLRAHALRALRKYAEAATAYEQFLKKHPQHASAESAAYERLLCLAAMDDALFEGEATAFLKAHPMADGAPRILLLMGDRAFRRKDFVAAAADYRAIPLEKVEPSLVPGILLRHGVSLVQSGRDPEALARFDALLQQFPNHEMALQALDQRAALQQRLGHWDAALKDYGDFAERFPKAAERENALDRIALLRGELRQFAAMREAFERLLKEYPKTKFSDDAAYWTGWSLFEEKKYAECISPLERARAANPSEYGAQAASRLLLARYQLHQRMPLIHEVDTLPSGVPPPVPEILDWIARQSLKEGDVVSAERFFQKLLTASGAREWRHATLWGLAASFAAQSKWKAARETLEVFLKETKEPVEIVAAKLELTKAWLGLKEFAAAQETAEEVLRLQPEGRNNAQARMLLGDIMAAQNRPEEAGKYFLSVAVLYEDAEITPKALTRAIQAFETAGATNEVARLRQELKTKYPNAR